MQFPKDRLQYYALLREGQNWRNLPLELQEAARLCGFEAMQL